KKNWDFDNIQIIIGHIQEAPITFNNAVRLMKKVRYYHVTHTSQIKHLSQSVTSIWLLESLVRLSQGHARLMMHSEVMAQDAVVAVTLMEASMCGASLIAGINPLHTAFPQSPREEYKNQAKVVLQKLGLIDILKEEIERLNEEEIHYNQMSATKASPKRPKTPGDSGAAQAKFPVPSISSKNIFRPDPTQQKPVTQIEELEEKTNKNLIMESFLRKKESKKKADNKICTEKETEMLTCKVVGNKKKENSVIVAEIHGDNNDSIFGAELDTTFRTIVHDQVKNKKQKGKAENEISTEKETESLSCKLVGNKKIENSVIVAEIHVDNNDSIFGAELDTTFSTIVHDQEKNKKQKGTKRKSESKINDIFKKQKIPKVDEDNISKDVTHFVKDKVVDDILDDLDMDFSEISPKWNHLKNISKQNSQEPSTSSFISSFNSNKKIKSLALKTLDSEKTSVNEDCSSENRPAPEKENMNDLRNNHLNTQSSLNKSLNTERVLYSDKKNGKFLPKFAKGEKDKNVSNSNKKVCNKEAVTNCTKNSVPLTSETVVISNDKNLDSVTKIVKKTPPSSIAEKLKRYQFSPDNNKTDIEIISNNNTNSTSANTANISSKMIDKKSVLEESEVKYTPKNASSFTDKKIKLTFKTPVFGSSQSSTSSQSPLLTSMKNKFAKDNQDFDDVDFDI
ncbi:unnamed protein product, partial [Meganyctiphanes norvegica]